VRHATGKDDVWYHPVVDDVGVAGVTGVVAVQAVDDVDGEEGDVTARGVVELTVDGDGSIGGT